MTGDTDRRERRRWSGWDDIVQFEWNDLLEDTPINVYLEEKKEQGGRSGRIFGEEIISPPKTAERIGEQFGVSHQPPGGHHAARVG